MNSWWNDQVPAFVVVGRVNAGKTSTLATLLEVDDDKVLRISSTPGETTRVHALPVIYDEVEWIRFLDTPGFQQPIAAQKKIRELAGNDEPTPADLRRFVEECADEFPDEALLLQPLLLGAGILYVVDSSKPLRDVFLAEMDILRWSGCPRVALLNQQGPETQYEEDWRQQLGTSFNLTRTFNAHAARFPERQKLMEALLTIDERHGERIRKVIAAMNAEWGQRREEAVETLMRFLEAALTLKVNEGLDEKRRHLPDYQERLKKQLETRYYQKLEDLEIKCLKEWLKTYRHHLVQADLDPLRHEGLDLTAEVTWKKYGLTRNQLAMTVAAAGAATGFLIDLATGGTSLGVATIIGALVGGAGAYLYGGKLPELKVTVTKIDLTTGEGEKLELGVPKNPNFPWVLLDSMLLRYAAILERAHARRDHQSLAVQDRSSIIRDLPRDRRKVLQQWFSSCQKGSPKRSLETELFLILLDVMERCNSEDASKKP